MSKTLKYIGALVAGMASLACTDYSGMWPIMSSILFLKGRNCIVRWNSRDRTGEWILSLTVITAWLVRRT